MATEYTQLLNYVWEEVENNLARKDNQSASFVRNHTATTILNDHKLRECYHMFAYLEAEGLTEAMFIRRVRERQLCKFLAISMYHGLNSDAFSAMIKVLVAANTWPLQSASGQRLDKLPAEPSQLEELFGSGSPGASTRFYRGQAMFCAAVIRKGEEVVIEDLNCERLPYMNEKLLGKGSVGHVYEIEVAKNHFYDVAEDQYNGNPKVIARKDYITSAGFDPTEERKILQQIMSSSGHTNIVTSLGSLRIKSRQVDGETVSTFSLFMPKADCDLRQYMLEKFPQAPDSLAGKERILACARGLARGLEFLHHGMETPAPERQKLICYDMDLKPANILVFYPDEDRMIWKLSDFGMSSIKIPKRRTQDNDEEKRFGNWFKLRSGYQGDDGPSVSETVGPRGQGTYLAPESVSQSPEMGRKSDVWSLGCIVSELFAYLEGGKIEVEKYTSSRQRQDGAFGDRYFLHSPGLASSKEHPVVKARHEEFIRNAIMRNTEEGQIVSKILKELEERVLKIDKDARCGAVDIEKMLDESCDGYKNLREPPPSLAVRAQDPRNWWTRTLTASFHTPRTQKPLITMLYLKAPEQKTSATQAFKDCAISSDGGSVAYWTGKDIFHCTTGHMDELVPFVYHLKSPEQWNSVSLTRQYLIASTTSSTNTFECYIINTREHSYHYIAIDRPKIYRLTVAQNNKQLICHLGPKDGPGPGSLCYAMISDLLTAGPGFSMSNRTKTSAEIDRPAIDTEWPTGTFKEKKLIGPDMLAWVPSNLSHLFVSRNVQERFTFVMSTEDETAIFNLPKDGSDVAKVKFDKNQHTQNSFLTDIVPLPQQPACAFITHRKTFHRQHFLEEASPVNFVGKIPNFKIRKLIPGWSDDELFALGTKSVEVAMRLLKITTPGPRNKVVVTDIVKLPDLYQQDEFAVTMPGPGLTVNGAKFIIIASIGPDKLHRRTVYRANLT